MADIKQGLEQCTKRLELIYNARSKGNLAMQKPYEGELKVWGELVNLLATTDQAAYQQLKEQILQELELANKKFELLWEKELPVAGIVPKQVKLADQAGVLEDINVDKVEDR